MKGIERKGGRAMKKKGSEMSDRIEGFITFLQTTYHLDLLKHLSCLEGAKKREFKGEKEKGLKRNKI